MTRRKGANLMTQKRHLIWISLGTFVTFLSGLLATLSYHAITWAPELIEIASVTWNDGPAGRMM